MDLRGAGPWWRRVQLVYDLHLQAFNTIRTRLTLTRGRTLISNISIRIDVTNVVIILLMSERPLCRPTRDIMAVRVYKIRCGVSK